MTALATSSRLKSIFAWALGAFFVLIGLISIGAHSVRGILLFLAAAILIPSTSRLIQEKVKLTLPKNNKIIIGIVALIIAFSLIPSSDKVRQEAAPATESSPQQTAVFDVPSLIGMDIDGVRSALGSPVDKDPELTKQQMQFGATEWYNSFNKEGRELTVTFDAKTRKITDFFISATDDGGDKQSLLAVGNLSESEPNYSVEFVKALQYPSAYTGVKVVPR